MDAKTRIYRFEQFIYDEINHKLIFEEQHSVELPKRSAEVLLILLENAGEIVNKEYFFENVWKDTFVEDGNLAVAIASLRKSFHSFGVEKKIIQTIPKRGYRFLSFVEEAERPLDMPLDYEVETDFETEADLNTAEKRNKTSNKFLSYKSAVSLVIALIAIVGTLGFYFRNNEEKKENPREVVSLVIPPFTQLNLEEKEYENLGLEIADRLILRFSKIDNVKVYPMWNTLSFESEDINSNQLELKSIADYVLTGTYITAGDSVEITIRLIRTSDWEGLIDKTIHFDKEDSFRDINEELVNETINATIITSPPALGTLPELMNGEVSDQAYSEYIEGFGYFSSDQFEKAKKSFQHAVELSPRFANAWSMLSRTYFLIGMIRYGKQEVFDLSEKALENALAIEPDNVFFRLEKIDLYIYANKYSLAMTQHKELAKHNETDPRLFRSLALLYMFTGLLEKSVEETERFLQHSPHSKYIFTQYIYTGQYDRFEETMYFNKKTAYSLYSLGYVKMYKGEIKNAIKWFDMSYELNKNTFPAQSAKVFSLILQDKDEEAKEILKSIEEDLALQTFSDTEGIYRVAQAYAMLGDKENALRQMKKAIESGFIPYTFFETDKFMKVVKNTPEFSQLIMLAKEKQMAFLKSNQIPID